MDSRTPRVSRTILIAGLTLGIPLLALCTFGVTGVLSAPRTAMAPNDVGSEGLLGDASGNHLADISYAIQAHSGAPLVSPPRSRMLDSLGDITITENTTWVSATVVLDNLVVTNSATLVLSGTTAITATNITVAEGAAISADGQGSTGTSGKGNGLGGGYGSGSGGGGQDTAAMAATGVMTGVAGVPMDRPMRRPIWAVVAVEATATATK